jgi:hypothetical protein
MEVVQVSESRSLSFAIFWQVSLLVIRGSNHLSQTNILHLIPISFKIFWPRINKKIR